MNPAAFDLGTNVAGHVRVPVAARRTGLSIRTLYEQIDAGALEARRDAHGMVVVPENALDSLDTPR